MTHRAGRVRIDRLVLRGVALDMHDAAALPARVAAELVRRWPGEAQPPPAPTTGDVAAHIAHRIAAEVRSQGRGP